MGAGGGVERLSSVVREESELQQLTKQLGRRELAEQHMRAFFTADGKTLITVIDQPYKPSPDGKQSKRAREQENQRCTCSHCRVLLFLGRPNVLYIMRNKFGKFAWMLRNTVVEPGSQGSLISTNTADPLYAPRRFCSLANDEGTAIANCYRPAASASDLF